MQYIRRLAWLTLMGLGLLPLASACSDRAWLSETDADAGSLGLALQFDPELGLRSVHYELAGPNGYTAIGDIDVTGSAGIYRVFDRLPAGSYAVTLSATGEGGSPTCSGSADFVVRVHSTTSVTVNLQCRVPGRTGSLVVNGSLNVCPTIDSLAALPRTLTVGETSKLNALASDVDHGPQTLALSWRASLGSLSNADVASPTFTASQPGNATITLRASDGDCSDEWSVDLVVLHPHNPDSTAPATGDTTVVAPATSTNPTASGDSESTDPEPTSTGTSTVSSSLEDQSSTGAPVFVPPGLVATATGARTTATPTTSVVLPSAVQEGDLAVAFLLATGTPHTVTSAPTGFVTRDLAAINHRLSYGQVSSTQSLTWTLSANATTSATVFFFRGQDLSVHVGTTTSSTGANFDVAGTTTGPAVTGPQTGFALLSIQLPLSSAPTITAGPGGSWSSPPISDGVQLFSWYQPYAWGQPEGSAFALPGVTGSTLSASATKRTAQVLVFGPEL